MGTQGVVAEVITEESKLRQDIEKDFQERFAAWKAKELADLEERQNKQIQDEVGKLYKKIQDETKPPTKEEIQLLVDQEYAEIRIKLWVESGSDEDGDYEQFVIRELPQSVERKFYKSFQSRLKDKATELAAFTQKNMDKNFEDQLHSFLDTFDGAFDVLSDAVALILNPFGKRAHITSEWVANNVSSNRQYSIILAQVEVNRLRDFFSRLFQSGQKAGTIMTPLNMTRLRQLVR